MATLPDNPTLSQLQRYIKDVCAERGWDSNNHLEIFLLFSEEVGELAKAIRNASGFHTEPAKHKRFELEEEFADVFAYLLDLANQFDVDLETAFRKKEQVNTTRTWENSKT